MRRPTLFVALCALSSCCRAQFACDIRLLYTRLLADAALADAFCTQYLDGTQLSAEFARQFGSDCESYRAELNMGCSIFNAAKRMLEPSPVTVTATSSETVTVTATPSTGPADSDTGRDRTEASEEAATPKSPVVRNAPAGYADQAVLGIHFPDSSDDANRLSSTLTSTTTSTFSKLTTATSSPVPSSTLSTTLSAATYRSTISSLASPSAASASTTGRCVPTATPAALDRHVFNPVLDLSLEPSGSTTAVVVHDHHDPDSENCAPYTMVYLPDHSPHSCVHLTGTWTPAYTNAVYECVARTRAPDFDPAHYPHGVMGLNFTTVDDSSSIINTRVLGPRPERTYKEANLTLFVAKQKTYTVDFWTCGSGPNIVVGELSCTHYGR